MIRNMKRLNSEVCSRAVSGEDKVQLVASHVSRGTGGWRERKRRQQRKSFKLLTVC